MSGPDWTIFSTSTRIFLKSTSRFLICPGAFVVVVSSVPRELSTVVDVFDVGDSQLPVNRRTLAVIEEGAGWPDGLTVDADGCVWVALWDGGAVRRYWRSNLSMPPRAGCRAEISDQRTDLPHPPGHSRRVSAEALCA